MRFSIVGIFSASWGLTVQHLLRTFGAGLVYMAVSGVIVAVAAGLAMMLQEQTLVAGLVIFVAAVLLCMTMTSLFNYWVRFAALGADKAWQPGFGKLAKAAFVNLVKFFFISLIIGIVLVVVGAGLAIAGLSGPTVQMDMENLTSFQGFVDYYARSVTPGQVAIQLISLSVGCVVYSLFSANLTGTALGDEREGLEHPHTLDFAVALLLIDATVVVPVFLLLMAGFPLLSIILNMVLMFPLLAAISIAHGIRYRMCLAERDMGGVAESA